MVQGDSAAPSRPTAPAAMPSGRVAAVVAAIGDLAARHGRPAAELYADRSLRTVFPPPDTDGGAAAGSVTAMPDHMGDAVPGDTGTPGLTVYVHIPFVQRDLIYHGQSVPLDAAAGSDPVDDYMALLHRELANGCRAGRRRVGSIYVGGGTPTAIAPALIDRLLATLATHFHLDPGGEFTLQATPETLSDAMLAVARDAGVNRLTLAVESFDQRYLDRCGAPYRAADIAAALDRARAAGIDKIHVDLVKDDPAGIGTAPRDLAGLAALLPNSVTRYPKRKRFDIPPSATGTMLPPDMRAALEEQIAFADQAGAIGYQGSCSVSDWFWRDPADQFQQQAQKWRDRFDLAAFGLGAHGYAAAALTLNHTDPAAYAADIKAGRPPLRCHRPLGADAVVARHCALGLRLGLPDAHLDQLYGIDKANQTRYYLRALLSGILTLIDHPADQGATWVLADAGRQIYPWLQNLIWRGMAGQVR